jgi:type IV secretory pathway TrbF-like protein
MTLVRKMCGMKTSSQQPAKRPESSKRPSVPPFTPGPIRESAVRKYFARGEMERITANRWFLATVFLGVLTLVNSVAWIVFLPMKTIETIVVHENSAGRETADLSGTASYVPDHVAIEYFLSEWINNVYDINASTIDNNLALAGKMTVGNATDELNALLHKENPYSKLHDNPQLRQTFNRLTANWITDDTLIIRFTLTELAAPGSTPKVTTWAMTITFVRIPPTTIEQVKINPGGIYAKSFNVNQEQ